VSRFGYIENLRLLHNRTEDDLTVCAITPAAAAKARRRVEKRMLMDIEIYRATKNECMIFGG